MTVTLVLHPTPVPRQAVDGLAEALSLPADELAEMIDARAWLSGHLPVPEEVGRLGSAMHRIWSVAEISRWLQHPQPGLDDRWLHDGLAR